MRQFLEQIANQRQGQAVLTQLVHKRRILELSDLDSTLETLKFTDGCRLSANCIPPEEKQYNLAVTPKIPSYPFGPLEKTRETRIFQRIIRSIIDDKIHHTKSCMFERLPDGRIIIHYNPLSKPRLDEDKEDKEDKESKLELDEDEEIEVPKLIDLQALLAEVNFSHLYFFKRDIDNYANIESLREHLESIPRPPTYAKFIERIKMHHKNDPTKRYDQLESLRYGQMIAIFYYTTSCYLAINQILRGNIASNPDLSLDTLPTLLMHATIAAYTLHQLKAPEQGIVTLLRFIGLSIEIQSELAKKAKNKTVAIERAFISTTTSSKWFNNKYSLLSAFGSELQKFVFTDIHGIAIAPLSSNEEEDEYLIPPRSGVMYLDYQEEKGRHTFWARGVVNYVPSPEVPAATPGPPLAAQPPSSSELIMNYLDALKKKAPQPASDEVMRNIRNIVNKCNEKYHNKRFYGNAALNRMILLDAELAHWLTADVILYLFTHDPHESEKIRRDDGLINLRDAIYYGLSEGLDVVKFMPNNEEKYSPDLYHLQKENFKSHVMAIVNNISIAARKVEIRVTEPIEPNITPETVRRELKPQFETVVSVIQAIKGESKSDKLLDVPGFSAMEMRQQVIAGFLALCRSLGITLEDSLTISGMGLATFCERFLNSEKALLDGTVIHAFYDRAHLEAALEQNTKIKIGGIEYTFADILKCMVEKITANPEKYPVASEQFYIRTLLVRRDLQKRFPKEYEGQAITPSPTAPDRAL